MTLWRLGVILTVEGGGQSDRSKSEIGSCCKRMHFFFLSLSLFLFFFFGS